MALRRADEAKVRRLAPSRQPDRQLAPGQRAARLAPARPRAADPCPVRRTTAAPLPAGLAPRRAHLDAARLLARDLMPGAASRPLACPVHHTT
jgi:hypothetical protein